jgi:hypothetical protein
MQRFLSGRWARWRVRVRSPLSRRAGARLIRSHRPGQTMAEAALTSLVVVTTLLITLQLSLIAAQAYSAQYVAQSTARWLAVHIDELDPAVVNKANEYASGLPGMSGGGLDSVTVNPSCTALTSGKCANRDVGDAITVSVTSKLSAVMFLPTSYGKAPYIISVPTYMPAVAYTTLLE